MHGRRSCIIFFVKKWNFLSSRRIRSVKHWSAPFYWVAVPFLRVRAFRMPLFIDRVQSTTLGEMEIWFVTARAGFLRNIFCWLVNTWNVYQLDNYDKNAPKKHDTRNIWLRNILPLGHFLSYHKIETLFFLVDLYHVIPHAISYRMLGEPPSYDELVIWPYFDPTFSWNLTPPSNLPKITLWGKFS